MNFAQNIHPTRLFGTTCLKWHLRVAKSISLVSLSKDTEDKENSITVQLVMVLSQIDGLNNAIIG